MTASILVGDCRQVLSSLADGSVDCVVTSPPYWGLRDYGHGAQQLGLEKTPQAYVANMVALFAEVHRVLTDEGTLWLNLGDCYATSGTRQGNRSGGIRKSGESDEHRTAYRGTPSGLKDKDLVGIPWRVALALQEDGWYLRSDIIWHKPNPMPESVTDRPTKAHEYLFLLAKSERYHYDADAIREPLSPAGIARLSQPGLAAQAGSDRAHAGTKHNGGMKAVPPRRSGNTERKSRAENGGPVDTANHQAFGVPWVDDGTGRNARSVWTITTQPYKGAHFATMPVELAKRCILAGCPVGGTVLDPFGGSGTTGLAAERVGRNSILIELKPEYVTLAERRIHDDAPLFSTVVDP